MRLKLKTRFLFHAATTLVGFIALGLIFIFILINVQLQNYRSETLHSLTILQEKYARQHFLKVSYHLESLLESFQDSVQSWAWWDVTQNAARHRVDSEVLDNYSDEGLASASINIVAVFDREGRLVLGRQQEAGAASKYGDLTREWQKLLGRDSPFWSLDQREGNKGFLLEEGILVFVSSYPVLGNSGQGEPGGVLVMGRYLTAEQQKVAQEKMETTFMIEPHSEAVASLSGLDPAFLDSKKPLPPLIVHGKLPAINPLALFLEVHVSSDLLEEERKAYWDQEAALVGAVPLYVLGIVLTNLALVLVFLFITQKYILSRIVKLDRFSREVTQSPDTHGVLELGGGDELTNIAGSVNAMITTLENRRDLVETRNAQLEELNKQLIINQEALKSSLIPRVITDGKGIITKVNPAFLDLYGYSEQEVLGGTPALLNSGRNVYWNYGFSDEQYEGIFSSLWKDVLDPEKGRWEGTLYNRKKDGQVLPAQVIISSIRTENQGLMGFIAWTINLSKRHDAERKLLLQAYSALSELAEKRDNETGHHLKRIGMMSSLLAGFAGLSLKAVQQIEICAPLHDIGKVGISDLVLLAPRRHSPEETAIMQTHSEIGYSILKDHPIMELAAGIALDHHEKWDGSGYPKGKKGEEIQLAARIVALVDVYDALRSARPYKKAWDHDQAIELIRSQRGLHFDPRLTDLFLENDQRFNSVIESFHE